MNKKVLVVDDSRSVRRMVSRKLENDLHLEVDTAEDLRSARALIEANPDGYLMAVVDLNLPDAPNGEVVDYISEVGLSSVVLTGIFDERIRKDLYNKNIIDYLLKDGSHDLDLICHTVSRLQANHETRVLVVDDSRFSRNYISRLLVRQHFIVLEAEDGQQALKKIEENPSVALVLTDYNMPVMDGFELITRLRRDFGKDRLAIIGISAAEDDYLTAKFIKLGANDFLKKPFGTEEFYCRVNQNLEMLDLFRKIKEASNTDFLTKLFNRRYFFDMGQRVYNRAVMGGQTLAVAMMDIDFFKKVNDLYGHDGGDLALRQVARMLRDYARPGDIVARFGGEEFCWLMEGIDPHTASHRLENFRQLVEEAEFVFEQKVFHCTLSIGLCCDVGDSLAFMLKRADERLYEAKNQGRNRLVTQ